MPKDLCGVLLSKEMQCVQIAADYITLGEGGWLWDSTSGGGCKVIPSTPGSKIKSCHTTWTWKSHLLAAAAFHTRSRHDWWKSFIAMSPKILVSPEQKNKSFLAGRREFQSSSFSFRFYAWATLRQQLRSLEDRAASVGRTNAHFFCPSVYFPAEAEAYSTLGNKWKRGQMASQSINKFSSLPYYTICNLFSVFHWWQFFWEPF